MNSLPSLSSICCGLFSFYILARKQGFGGLICVLFIVTVPVCISYPNGQSIFSVASLKCKKQPCLIQFHVGFPCHRVSD